MSDVVKPIPAPGEPLQVVFANVTLRVRLDAWLAANGWELFPLPANWEDELPTFGIRAKEKPKWVPPEPNTYTLLDERGETISVGEMHEDRMIHFPPHKGPMVRPVAYIDGPTGRLVEVTVSSKVLMPGDHLKVTAPRELSLT